MFRNEYKTIKKSGLFDEKYYLEIYEDVRKSDINPLKHYIKNGWKEGRNPSESFNTNDYIQQNNILLNSKYSPLFHQIKSLSNKQKATLSEYNIIKRSGLFDEKYYLQTYEDVKNANIEAIKHFMEFGWKEKRNPSDRFNTNFYLETYKDVKEANINPLIHYIKYGRKEERSIQPENNIVVVHKVSKIKKLIFITKYAKNNPHLVKKFFIEVKAHGLLCAIQKINSFNMNRNIDNNHSIKFENIDLILKKSLNKKFKIMSGKLDTNTNNQLDIIQTHKIAIHLHLYYLDLLDYFINYLNYMPYEYDLYISIVNGADKEYVTKEFQNKLKKMNAICVEQVPNKGRDIAPLIIQFGKRLLKYDYIAHIHSKKSIHNNKLNTWLDEIMGTLFGSEQNIKNIITLLSSGIKFVYPENKYENVMYHNCGWSGNYRVAEKVLGKYTKLNISDFEYVDFPQGFMFWSKRDALNDFLSLPLEYKSFESEPIGSDGTLAHALERLPFVLSNNLEGSNYKVTNSLENSQIILDVLDDYLQIEFIKKLLMFALQNNKISLSIVHMETVNSLGGVQRYLWFDTIDLNENSIDSVIIFKSIDRIGLILNNVILTESLNFEELIEIIIILQDKYDVCLSIHHCLNWDISELKSILDLEIKTIAFFHDDYWIKTEEFNRLFSSKVNLNKKKDYIEFYKNLIKKSEKLVFPSEFIEKKFIDLSSELKQFKNKIVVSGNLFFDEKQLVISKHKNNKLRIAYLGYKAQHKGWELFEKIISNKNLNDKYDMYHIGADDLEKNDLYTKIIANYKYMDKTPEYFLKKYDIDIVLLFSNLEESYSYTMYEAIAANACIITSDHSGNICDTIKNNKVYGKIFSTQEFVVEFLNNYDFVLDWTLKNPNKNEMMSYHNSFILQYLKEGNIC